MGMKIGNIKTYGIIYKIENLINGKVYIGQTTKSRGFRDRYYCKGNGIERVYNYYLHRKDDGSQYNEYLLNSIKKYGFINFKVTEVLDVAFSLEELNIKEECWIKIYNSTDRRYGYNFKKGGDNYEYSKDSKVRNGVKLICIDDNLIFKSYEEAIRYYNVSKSWIDSSCKLIHTYKNFKKEYPIFRKYKEISVTQKLCPICGREVIRKHLNSNQKYCDECKDKINSNEDNIVDGYKQIYYNLNYDNDFKFHKYESENLLQQKKNKKIEIDKEIRKNINNKIKSSKIQKIIYEKFNDKPSIQYINNYRKILNNNKYKKYDNKVENKEKLKYEQKIKDNNDKYIFLLEHQNNICELYKKYKHFNIITDTINKNLKYRIDNNDIKYILKLNSIEIIDHKYDDSNIHYIKLYKNNIIINIFKFKSQCANWFVENKILKTYKFAKSRISYCLDKNKDIEGYYVKTSNKEEYDKFN